MPVIIVNQTMAQRFWPRANPIGQRVTLLPATTGGPTRECTIVGIAQDGKHNSLREAVEPALYLPYGQATRDEMTVVARGARPADVVADVLKQGTRFAAIGSAIGLLLAGIAGRLMSGTLYDVSAVDPLTYAGVTVLVMLIALAAAYLPARRAARIDPIVALRCQ
jgi:hypothetical protein